MSVDVCAWQGGLDGHAVLAVDTQTERIIDSIESYAAAVADGVFPSAQVQGIVAGYTLVAALYRCGSTLHNSLDVDGACNTHIAALRSVDPSCAPTDNALTRLEMCCDGHSMMLRPDEMMARLLMECRRIMRTSTNLHQAIIQHLSERQKASEQELRYTSPQDPQAFTHPAIGNSLQKFITPNSSYTSCILNPQAVSAEGNVLIPITLNLKKYTHLHVLCTDDTLTRHLHQTPAHQLIPASKITTLITAHGIIENINTKTIAQHISIGGFDGFSIV